jgi:hypothetical protein
MTSVIQKIEQDVRKIIEYSRGRSLDETDTHMLRKIIEKLESHFSTIHRRSSNGPIVWPDDYLNLEAEYCDTELRRFHECETDHGKGFFRIEILRKRDEFNNMWNLTHVDKFHITNKGRKE